MSCAGYVDLTPVAPVPRKRHIHHHHYAPPSGAQVESRSFVSQKCFDVMSYSGFGDFSARSSGKPYSPGPETSSRLFQLKQTLQALRLEPVRRLLRMINSPPMIMPPPRACAELIVSPSHTHAAAIATIGVRFWIMAA